MNGSTGTGVELRGSIMEGEIHWGTMVAVDIEVVSVPKRFDKVLVTEGREQAAVGSGNDNAGDSKSERERTVNLSVQLPIGNQFSLFFSSNGAGCNALSRPISTITAGGGII